MTKHDLDRMKAAVAIMKDKVKHEKDRDILIERDKVKRAFFSLYRIDSEEFLQLSASLTPKICQSIFKTSDPEVMTKVSEIIDTELYKTQNHIRISLNNELKNMKLEAVS